MSDNKKPLLFLLLLFLMMLHGNRVQGNDILLRFTANHTCTHVALDSIMVENLTQGGAMILYYPDTVLNLVTTNIHDILNVDHELTVSQNYPNPFREKTKFDVFLPETGPITINIYDLTGRWLYDSSFELQSGLHHFKFIAGNQQSYLLSVSTASRSQQQLMLQTAPSGSAPEIFYLGPGSHPKDDVQNMGGFDFNFGDELRFTGYVTDAFGNFDYEIIIDSPAGNHDYFFDIENNVPGQPSEISGATTVAPYTSGLIYEVIKVPGLEYIWTVPEGWVINSGQGSESITVTAGSNPGILTVLAENNCGTGPERTLAVDVEDDAEFICGTNITFNHGGEHVTYGTIERHGLCWMDRNLGASPLPFNPSDDATSNADARLFGDLYQWGRLTDGHQARNSNTTHTLSDTDVPGHNYFIMNNNQPYDWRIPQNNELWQGEEGINNPCPQGWRLPTDPELNAERLSWNPNSPGGAFNSPLTWPVGGYRNSVGTLLNEGSWGLVWSNTVSGPSVRILYYFAGVTSMLDLNRAFGANVRCVQELD